MERATARLHKAGPARPGWARKGGSMTQTEMETIGAGRWFLGKRERQERAYVSGKAFQSHCRAAHTGREEANCAACQTLKAKLAISAREVEAL